MKTRECIASAIILTGAIFQVASAAPTQSLNTLAERAISPSDSATKTP